MKKLTLNTNNKKYSLRERNIFEADVIITNTILSWLRIHFCVRGIREICDIFNDWDVRKRVLWCYYHHYFTYTLRAPRHYDTECLYTVASNQTSSYSLEDVGKGKKVNCWEKGNVVWIWGRNLLNKYWSVIFLVIEFDWIA